MPATAPKDGCFPEPYSSAMVRSNKKIPKEVLWLEHFEGSGHIYYPDPLHERKAEVLELVGQWDQAEDIRRSVLGHARAGGCPEERTRTMLNLCKLLQRRGRYAESEALSREALSLASGFKNPKLLGQSLAALGVVNWRRGDHDRAVELFNRAIELYQETRYPEGISAALNNLGGILEGRGEYAKAMECYRQKLDIDRAAGNKRGLANVLNNLGVCLVHQGDLQRAEEMFLEKLALEQAMGNKAGVATALTNLAIIYRNRREYQRALDSCRRTIDICREMGDQRVEGIATNNMGNIYKEQDLPHQALDCYQAALAVAESQGDRKDIAIYSGNIAQIHHYWLKDPATALEYYNRTVEILSEMRQIYHLCAYRLYRCQLLMELERNADIEAELSGIEEEAARAGRKDIEYQASIVRARLEARSDQKRAAAGLRDLCSRPAEGICRAEALFWLAVITGDQADRKTAIEALEALGDAKGSPEVGRWLKRLRNGEG